MRGRSLRRSCSRFSRSLPFRRPIASSLALNRNERYRDEITPFTTWRFLSPFLGESRRCIFGNVKILCRNIFNTDEECCYKLIPRWIDFDILFRSEREDSVHLSLNLVIFSSFFLFTLLSVNNAEAMNENNDCGVDRGSQFVSSNVRRSRHYRGPGIALAALAEPNYDPELTSACFTLYKRC